MGKFICGYCGKEYATVEERMECERACRAKQLQEEEKKASEERNAKMEADYKDLTELIKKRDEMNDMIRKSRDEYSKKYYSGFTPKVFTFFDDPWFRIW